MMTPVVTAECNMHTYTSFVPSLHCQRFLLFFQHAKKKVGSGDWVRSYTYARVQVVYEAVIQDVVGVGNDLAHEVNLSCAERDTLKIGL